MQQFFITNNRNTLIAWVQYYKYVEEVAIIFTAGGFDSFLNHMFTVIKKAEEIVKSFSTICLMVDTFNFDKSEESVVMAEIYTPC